ncbi:MAG: DMT family transporter [Nitrososphaerales archaeon]
MFTETLLGSTLALLTAFGWALTSVLLRRVRGVVKPFQSAFISSIIGVVAISTSSAVLGEARNLLNTTPTAAAYCVAAGLANFALGRFLWYSGINIVGASRSNSIVALEILFAPLLAVLLLKEEAEVATASAILVILVGVLLISKSYSRSDVFVERREFYIGILISLGAAIVFSFGALLTKLAVVSVGSPLVAFVIGSLASTTALAPAVKGLNAGYGRRDWGILILAGFSHAVAGLAYWSALKFATVVLVTPLTQAYPLFTLLLSYLYIKRLENLNLMVILGALLITIGVVAATLS